MIAINTYYFIAANNAQKQMSLFPIRAHNREKAWRGAESVMKVLFNGNGWHLREDHFGILDSIQVLRREG